ncbi:E3 ubiquitin-protein ligase TRIM8-like [Bufo gargarizans]|uniref:E3 ubiquitin-protein ligase TRIM8-like n=1 Tax=Bufo gargarizans TaxID=30331 RepID=UPI001CF0E880|nr:E3 ubiquitin-protein ligase TRIM8-like [Bufo gargarizans]
MASAGLRRGLECSICFNFYTNPVTLRCGHKFCRDCIDQVPNTLDGSGVYACPECRAQFQERPALQKNITLCRLVKIFQFTQPHQEETKMWCTYCVDYPVPAVKSCLHCEASLCDKHLRFHSKSAEHVLTEASTSLKNRKCSIHKKILEYYCTSDATCICVSCCLIGEHQGHEIKSLDEASEIGKKKLRNGLQKLITKREEIEERVWSLEDCWRKAKVKAAGKAESVTALFIDIRRRIDDVEKRIMTEFSRQEEQVSLSLSSLIHKLEINMEQLSRLMRYIEEVCNITDPLIFLRALDTRNLCDPEEEEGVEDTLTHDGGDWGAELISRISQTLSDIIRDINVTFSCRGSCRHITGCKHGC